MIFRKLRNFVNVNIWVFNYKAIMVEIINWTTWSLAVGRKINILDLIYDFIKFNNLTTEGRRLGHLFENMREKRIKRNSSESTFPCMFNIMVICTLVYDYINAEIKIT